MTLRSKLNVIDDEREEKVKIVYYRIRVTCNMLRFAWQCYAGIETKVLDFTNGFTCLK